MNTQHYDVIIVGGGATGSALALLLAPLKKRVLLIESQAQQHQISSSHFDERALAVSRGSQLILQKLGVWPALQSYAEPIRNIHVSDRGQFGHSHLAAETYQLPALGYVIELRALNSVLFDAVQQRKAADILAPATVQTWYDDEQAAHLVVTHDNETLMLSADALLACDGSQSRLRQIAGIALDSTDYQQTAVIANLTAERNPDGWAFERFTETGPLALLPQTQQRWSLVWCLSPADAAEKLALNDAAFLAQLQQSFGWRLNRFKTVGKRQAFALQRLISHERRRGRLLLMGNAAQQVHPIAGQGFNLALRDAECFASHYDQHGWNPAMITHFLNDSERDRHATLNRTHALVRLFSNDYPLLSPLRALALDSLHALPVLNEHIAHTAMGLNTLSAS